MVCSCAEYVSFIIEIAYMNINEKIASELSVEVWQVDAAVKLLSEGATVPFIARYRKEVTGTLSDDHLRTLEERLHYLHELEDRRVSILKSIDEQGKLTEDLKKNILSADNKARLEDLYLPYKPKRRTKAQIAIEAGLEPLAQCLVSDPTKVPEEEAAKYIDEKKEIKTIKDALDGAKQILMERFSEDADLLEKLRGFIWQRINLVSEVVEAKKNEGQKFKDYFEYKEALAKVPSHRALAVLRGRKEGVLKASLELEEQDVDSIYLDIAKISQIEDLGRPADLWLKEVVEWTWKYKLKLKLDVDLMIKLKEASELVAIDVFKDNLKNLLMAAPAGNFVVMGLDPGLRTGVKVVVIDETGKLLDKVTIFPHQPKNQWDGSIHALNELSRKHNVKLVSIGNGTASRETDKLVLDLTKQHADLKLTKVVVSEAGASVYSASKLASQEFPDLDVSYRGAVSIARRLQDPLAELVKIEPKAIGVGQYQHDVNQVKLDRSLSSTIEDCVNAVGADVNTASVPLMKSIAGLNETVAQNIIKFREEHGRFKTREQLKEVPRFGDKTFEQAAGFLRVVGGDNPLDASSVHPESYDLVTAILEKMSLDISNLIGNEDLLAKVSCQDFVTDKFGLPTIKDVLAELKKPGRDPRPQFKTAEFMEGVHEIKDLKPEMLLEGVVTNVTNFGAFIDIGVHQDGLVHISEMSTKFIKDPHEIVKVGDILKVKVLDVDAARKRIQLTLVLAKATDQKRPQEKNTFQKPKHATAPKARKPAPVKATGFGDALLEALGKS